ncbi:ribonuclease P protein subunit [Candidatus Woesearchaeota archaeon]|nr:ribonuclease P protein subunit [Candidatus Woesearchaeota archaeon]
MARTPFTIAQHELIGLEVEARTGNAEKIQGTIVDESHDSLTLLAGKTFKRVNKQRLVFTTNIQGTSIEVDGKAIARRPEDRIKK